ncbi:substrate-binding periplasmic protein [Silvanigrella aquatica]|uniref:Solute-binding protein family 3/N-terminal domain-containing protein n=1 Tax=Silvanigrella aquatica TaxID=1915309 RepID=A0A1L4D0S2_9BACT|nr:transporter substrate-binding domain-containing protein [Silvanigrella aquatica]APJ03787.1 hypothetical protein AXG55_07655 [Silvanigrella aquatica]
MGLFTRKILRIFIIFLFIMSVSSSFAEEWKGACEKNYPPFNYINKNKKLGMDYEIINLVMRKLGVKYSVHNDSWDKVHALLKDEEVDFAWQFVSTPERQKLFYLVGPIRYGLHAFMVRKSSTMINWHKLSDFDKKRIGIVRKYNYTTEFDNYKNFTKVEFANNNDLIIGLTKGFVDAIIGDFYTLSFEARTNNYTKQVRFLPSSVKKIPRYVAFSKKNKDKSIAFGNALKTLIQTAEYKEIIKKYSAL